MKLFEQVKPEIKQVRAPTYDDSWYIKRNLLRSVTKTGEVYSLIEQWLRSFEGGMSKRSFDQQMKRLDWDDTIATTQLQRAMGRRVIPLPPPPKKPALPKNLVEQMLDDTYVAVYGRKFRPAIKEAVSQLKQCGQVYVLQVEQLILEFKDYEHKGESPQMIDKAIDCDFLVIVNLEMTIHIEWHIHEALNRILRFRQRQNKPIISTWNRYNDVNDFFEAFKIYIVE